MQQRLNRPRLFACELALVLLIVAGIGSCSRRGDADRYHFPPGVPEELIHHLTSSDDSTLDAFVLDTGWQETTNIDTRIGKQEIDLFLTGREQEALDLMRLRKRLARAFASVYYAPFVFDDIEYMQRLSREDLRTVLSLRNQFYRARDDDAAPVDEQLDRAFYFLHEFERLGDRLHTAGSKSRIAAAFDAIGNHSEYLRYLRDAVSDYIELGQIRMACQELGVLGTIFEQSGEIDSMLACYAYAQRLADRSRNPEQAARLRTFYAHYYAKQGRLSLAYDLFNEAIDVCRDFKGGSIELRYIYEAAAFHIDLGCYDVAEKLLQRARLVRRQTKPDEINKFISNFDYVLYRADYLEARTEMGLGHLDEAERLMRRTVTEMEKRPAPYRYRDEYVKLYYYWAQGLFDSGRYEKAAMIGQEGLQRARKVSAPVWAARSALLLAKARRALGDLSASQRHLDEFESLARGHEDDLQTESILRYCLLGEIALANSDRPRAISALAAAAGEIESVAAGLDVGVHGYLWLNN
jgi:tetratricopeptide (TPR) repeat protein